MNKKFMKTVFYLGMVEAKNLTGLDLDIESKNRDYTFLMNYVFFFSILFSIKLISSHLK